ncbi:unnamed protein product, partial [Iphiclides podalirius]
MNFSIFYLLVCIIFPGKGDNRWKRRSKESDDKGLLDESIGIERDTWAREHNLDFFTQKDFNANPFDVRCLLGRSLARIKATHYNGALADVIKATELEPTNLTALQIKAQTEYEKCAFERSLVLASRGQCLRVLPPDFAECARCAEETIRECAGPSAKKVMKAASLLLKGVEIKGDLIEEDIFKPKKVVRRSRMLKEPTQHVIRL